MAMTNTDDARPLDMAPPTADIAWSPAEERAPLDLEPSVADAVETTEVVYETEPATAEVASPTLLSIDGAPTWTPPVANTAAVAAARQRTAATRAAAERAELRAAEERAQAAVDAAIVISLGDQGGSYPHGCLVNWHPAGKRSWSVLAASADAADVPRPAQRSNRSVASDAVRSIARGGLYVETVKRGAIWNVYRSAKATEVDQSVGAVHVIARLVDGDRLELEGPADLCAVVREAWDTARSEATVGSTEVTTWLAGILHFWRAVPTIYGRWVPSGRSAEWLRLAAALNGAGLPVPKYPAGVARRADITEEVTLGLLGEVEALIAAVRGQRDRAVKGGKDLGARAAATALRDAADVRTKIGMYEVMTGPLPAARAALDALVAEVTPLTNDLAQRGANLELD